MKFTELNIIGLYLIAPTRHSDERGYFSEVFQSSKFKEATGLDIDFVQDNVSSSRRKGTIRGLHYQSAPYGQGKLVRCSRGEILDVAVDARQGSATYGQHCSVVLSAQNGHQLWIPEGFLHGFATLSDDCEVAYKVTQHYDKASDGAVFWDDPYFNIDWRTHRAEAIVSEKDKVAPLFADFKSSFAAD